MSPTRLAANRRNAQKCTGPRTARGKAQSRLNALRDGGRSALYQNLMRILLVAPPCAVDRTARAVLTPELAAHPLFAGLVEVFRQAEIDVVLQTRLLLSPEAALPAPCAKELTAQAEKSAKPEQAQSHTGKLPKKDVNKIRTKPLCA